MATGLKELVILDCLLAPHVDEGANNRQDSSNNGHVNSWLKWGYVLPFGPKEDWCYSGTVSGKALKVYCGCTSGSSPISCALCPLIWRSPTLPNDMAKGLFNRSPLQTLSLEHLRQSHRKSAYTHAATSFKQSLVPAAPVLSKPGWCCWWLSWYYNTSKTPSLPSCLHLWPYQLFHGGVEVVNLKSHDHTLIHWLQRCDVGDKNITSMLSTHSYITGCWLGALSSKRRNKLAKLLQEAYSFSNFDK